jgi:predicted cobalt transporter CbtA
MDSGRLLGIGLGLVLSLVQTPSVASERRVVWWCQQPYAFVMGIGTMVESPQFVASEPCSAGVVLTQAPAKRAAKEPSRRAQPAPERTRSRDGPENREQQPGSESMP